MTDDKTKTTVLSDALEEDLEFTIVKPLPKNQPPVDESKKVETKSWKKSKTAEKKEELLLDEVDYSTRTTRTERFQELQKAEPLVEEDLFVFANPVMRGMACILDTVFYAGLGFLSYVTAPLEMVGVDYFLEKYKLVLPITPELAINVIVGLNIVLSIFFFIVIPVSFYNRTFGKKITGLHVRGVDSFTISIPQAFKREIFWKPISLALIVGIFMPFFTKHKQSLHDRMCSTFVIKE